MRVDGTATTLAEALAERRRLLGHTFRQCAEAIGYRSPSSISGLEDGEQPRESMYEAIAGYLAISMERFLELLHTQRELLHAQRLADMRRQDDAR